MTTLSCVRSRRHVPPAQLREVSSARNTYARACGGLCRSNGPTSQVSSMYSPPLLGGTRRRGRVSSWPWTGKSLCHRPVYLPHARGANVIVPRGLLGMRCDQQSHKLQSWHSVDPNTVRLCRCSHSCDPLLASPLPSTNGDGEHVVKRSRRTWNDFMSTIPPAQNGGLVRLRDFNEHGRETRLDSRGAIRIT